MRYRKLNTLIFAIAASLCIISCKKDDESKVTPSLKGTLSFTASIPEYVLPNTTVTLTPAGVEHPDGEELGYYWKVTPTRPKADTTRYQNGLDKQGNPSDGSFTFTFSDTLQTCTITGYAFAKGYTYSSKSVDCTVVEGGIDRSITNLNLNGKPSITVDGIQYPYVTIGGSTVSLPVEDSGEATDGSAATFDFTAVAAVGAALSAAGYALTKKRK